MRCASERRPDAFDRLETETDPWGDFVKHTYDVQGNRKTTTAQGGTTLYGYDSLNRRTTVTTAGGAITTGSTPCAQGHND